MKLFIVVSFPLLDSITHTILFHNVPCFPKEACSLLPKISSKETHPRIPEVLLERHKPDVALVVLKCTGHDSFSATANIEKGAHRSSWMYHVEVMTTEFCNICIERNIVVKMIDLPWDFEEEKHLNKSLFGCAREMPTEACGSLLVIFYL